MAGDEELRKAFQELVAQTNEKKRLIQIGENTKRICKQAERAAELTKKQLTELPDGQRVYRSVGRLFLLASRESEIARQDEEMKAAIAKAAAVDRQKELLEKSLEEAEKNIREMVQTRRAE